MRGGEVRGFFNGEVDVLLFLVDGQARLLDVLVVDRGEDEGDKGRCVGGGGGSVFREHCGVLGYACAATVQPLFPSSHTGASY